MGIHPVLVCGLMFLLVGPSDALTCYECTYSTDDNTTDGSTPCGQSLDPARVANCSGSGCYSYIYNYSSAGQEFSVIFRGCAESPVNTAKENCLQNSKIFDANFFLYEGQCCYNMTDGNAGATSCFCEEGNYCNYHISQWATIEPTNDTSTVTPEPPLPNGTPTGSIHCYSCLFSGVDSDISTSMTCEKPFTPREGGTCGGEACLTYQYISKDHTSKMIRSCVDDVETYNDNIRNCRENATFAGITFFFYENQCCFSHASDTLSSATCYCADNYCNAKFLPPIVVPGSNDTTTFSSYNPQNTNFPQLTTTRATIRTTLATPFSISAKPANEIVEPTKGSAFCVKHHALMMLAALLNILVLA